MQSTHKAVRTCKLFLLRIMPAMEIRAKFLAKPSPEQLLHYCKLHMGKKLWEWGVQKPKPSVCTINAQSGTSLQIDPHALSLYNAWNGNSRKFPANPSPEQLLHYCKLHMSKKLWEWGVQKPKPTVCAINAQSGKNL